MTPQLALNIAAMSRESWGDRFASFKFTPMKFRLAIPFAGIDSPGEAARKANWDFEAVKIIEHALTFALRNN